MDSSGSFIVVLLLSFCCLSFSAEENSRFLSRKIVLALNEDELEPPSYRFPLEIIPNLYILRMTPILEPENFTTLGNVQITVNCLQNTGNITLNAADLSIDEESIQVLETGEDEIYLRILKLTDEQESREMVTIQVSPPGLMAGKQYIISMSFTSQLNDQLRGFYRSSYQESGETKYLGVTQLAATDARRAFPCFDEPNLKAEFSVVLGRPKNMISSSNMRLTLTLPHPDLEDYVMDNYERSPRMSTYLVAMMISDFVKIRSDPSSSPGIDFNVLVRPGLEDQTNYAGTIGPKILDSFGQHFFEIPYPLKKMDLAAIPDFVAGAMENWGLITFRESGFLVNETRSTAAAKQKVASILANVLAHQWLGNLVTMDWWDSVWLNEAFSTFIADVGVDFVEPGFEINKQFVVDNLQYALRVDALDSSQPITRPVETPSEILQLFDDITYKKGPSLLRMCRDLVGEETFRKGMIRYLKANAYGNVVEENLWSAIQVQAQEDAVAVPFGVRQVMQTWTSKKGYPVVTVNRNYENGRAVVSQKRFVLTENEGSSTDPTVYRWHISLTYTSNFALPPRTNWLDVNSVSTTLTTLSANSNQWVIFNVGQIGYYRVAYDDTNLGLINNQLTENHLAIPPDNRAQILDDYFNLARANLTSYDNPLDLTQYLVKERDYAPWKAASVSMDFIDVMLFGLTSYNEWKNYVTELFGNLFNYVGFTPSLSDSHILILTRSIGVDWACVRLGLSSCVQPARALYTAWMADPSDSTNMIPNDLRELVACTGVANGGTAEYTFAWRMYNETVLANEKLEFLRAMTCSKNPIVLYNLLTLMITRNSGIRIQDANTLFSSIASNSLGHQIALDFLVNRWDDIEDYLDGYAGLGAGFPGFFKALCNRVNTQAKLDKLEKLVTDHPNELASSRSVQQGLELARSSVQWVADFRPDVLDWLRARNVETTLPSSSTTSTPIPTSTSTTSTSITSTTTSPSTTTVFTTTEATTPLTTTDSTSTATEASTSSATTDSSSTATEATTSSASTRSSSTITVPTSPSTITETSSTTPTATTPSSTTTSTLRTTSTSGFVCVWDRNGNFAISPCNSQFVMCSNGNAYIIDCPTGLFFNSILNFCDFPRGVGTGC